MSAHPTAAVKNAPSQGQRVSNEPRADVAPEQQFGRRLDHARKQQGAQEPSDSSSGRAKAERPSAQASDASSGSPQASGSIHDRAGPTAPQKPVTPGEDPPAGDDAAALAAMLAALGHVLPADPLAAATTAALGPDPLDTRTPGLGRFGDPGLAPEAGKLPAAGGTVLPPFLTTADAGAGAGVPTPAVATFAELMMPTPAEGKQAAGAGDLAGLLGSGGILPTGLPPPPPGVHSLGIDSPVGSSSFAVDLGHQITWLGSQDLKQARIRLHPQELGSLDVSVSVNHNRVDISFAVQHPAAAHAVQQSLAQLDNMLAQQGMSLGQADVGPQQHGGDQSGRAGHAGAGAAEAADDVGTSVQALATTTLPGLLDTFA